MKGIERWHYEMKYWRFSIIVLLRMVQSLMALQREGNVATNAFPVFFGPRERQDRGWLLFWECPEDEAGQLRQNPGLRFDVNQPFVIPLLANERNVRYYLNTNIGYGQDIDSLREGMIEYGRRVGRQILDDELVRSWVPRNNEPGNDQRDNANRLNVNPNEEVRPDMQEQIKQLVKSNLQVILTGAPGTGKTFTARQVAEELVCEGVEGDENRKAAIRDRIQSVQFHPGYDYSDFVIGLKPVVLDAEGNEVAGVQDGNVAGNGNVHVSFRWKDGIFKDFAQKAKLAYDAAVHDGGEVPKFVFLIDEINRADLSRVFGELFSLLEEDYRYPIREGVRGNVHGITLPNGVPFVVPENLYIIGTMNDIDRSVESMDFALRRRFAWKEIKAEESSCILKEKINDEDVRKRLTEAMAKINEKIAEPNLRLGAEYQLGGAIFAKYIKYADCANAFGCLWDNHIKTILNEYLRGRRDKEEKLKELKDVYNKKVQVVDEGAEPQQA